MCDETCEKLSVESTNTVKYAKSRMCPVLLSDR